LPSSLGTFTAEEDTSYRNENEASYIVQLLKDLFRAELDQRNEVMIETIGIVTPYSAQVTLLKTMMASDPHFIELAEAHPSVIEVSSVDGFQGRERDLILFSAVRSNRLGKIGFLKDWRRMNVALTRAKSGIVVVGDMITLKNGDVHWEAFCNWCQSVGCVISS